MLACMATLTSEKSGLAHSRPSVHSEAANQGSRLALARASAC